jgi:hypothetical protein
LRDALVGRLPAVCCVRGTRADGLAPVVVAKPLGIAWFLLLAGPVGVVVLIALWPRLRVRYVIRLPMSEAAFDRYQTLRARRLWLGWLGGWSVVLGALLVWIGPLGPLLMLVGAGGVLAALVAHFRLPWSVPSAACDRRGTTVTLLGVHPRFVRAVSERRP